MGPIRNIQVRMKPGCMYGNAAIADSVLFVESINTTRHKKTLSSLTLMSSHYLQIHPLNLPFTTIKRSVITLHILIATTKHLNPTVYYIDIHCHVDEEWPNIWDRKSDWHLAHSLLTKNFTLLPESVNSLEERARQYSTYITTLVWHGVGKSSTLKWSRSV